MYPYVTWRQSLALNVLYYTSPHQLCRWEVKDVHGLQSFLTHSEERDSLFFIICMQEQMLLLV